MEKIVLVTGGFDPIHSGHINYFKSAKTLGDMLIVGLNSDEWLERKKGRAFMPFNERSEIVQNIVGVDSVIGFNDDDGSAINAIHTVRALYPDSSIIFANGGDRVSANIPEMSYVDDKLEFAFAVGGANKANSSSWILEEWKAPKTKREWGYYRVLHENNPTVKLKELTVDPGKALSMQRHDKRNEFWFVTEGIATVYTLNVSTDLELLGEFKKHQHIWIDNRQWHQLRNETQRSLKIIEIQYGENCVEEDIERR